tara:strand:+ start:430 stop:813 length:384 start_codon:yes stop_codon:yes gene_type:complete
MVNQTHTGYGRPSRQRHYDLAVEPVKLGDPGNGGRIGPAGESYVYLVTGGAETRKLTDPIYAGQILDLFFETDGGNCVITADSAINQAGNTIMTLADAGDHIRLIGGRDGAGDKEWRVVANDGVALS